jgi:hypothetical protein
LERRKLFGECYLTESWILFEYLVNLTALQIFTKSLSPTNLTWAKILETGVKFCVDSFKPTYKNETVKSNPFYDVVLLCMSGFQTLNCPVDKLNPIEYCQDSQNYFKQCNISSVLNKKIG